MAGSNNGGSSYQKYDGASGSYQPVDGSDFEDLNSGSNHGRGAASGGNRWKTLAAMGVVVAAAVGVYYTVTTPKMNHNQEQIDKAISASGSGLQVKSNGKLKLFDSLST
jgi:hypothetical protein